MLKDMESSNAHMTCHNHATCMLQMTHCLHDRHASLRLIVSYAQGIFQATHSMFYKGHREIRTMDVP